MKKTFFILLLSTFVMGAFSQNRSTMKDISYSKNWLQVAEYQKKSLPQSASLLVDSILLDAIKDENSPQVIKALIHQGKYQLAQDLENDTIIFNNLNKMLVTSNDKVEESVIKSMLGELYLQYYMVNQWTINQRTDLGDYVPSDIKEWTRNIFYNKVVEHLNASISEKDILTNAKVEDYAAVVDLGKDSRIYYPSMIDFLLNRAIDQFNNINSDEDLSRTLTRKGITVDTLFVTADEFVNIDFKVEPTDYNLWVYETYRKLIESLKERGNEEGVLFTELGLIERLSIMNNSYTAKIKERVYILMQKWEGNPISVEIIDKLANVIQREIFNQTEDDKKKKTELTKEIYELLIKGIQQYPDYRRIAILENRVNLLTSSQFSITGNNTFPSKGEKMLSLSYRNLKTFNAKLYRINSPIDLQMGIVGIGYDINENAIFLKDINIPLPPAEKYILNDTTFIIDIDAPGTYMLSFDPPTNKESYGSQKNYYFAVSDLAAFSRLSKKDDYEFYVVDRVSGKPVKSAKVNIYELPGNWRDSKLVIAETLITNADGYANYKKTTTNYEVFYNVELSGDNGSLLNRLPGGLYRMSNELDAEQEAINIFTDRSLFRPGQTVYFKAILTNTKEGKHQLQTEEEIEFTLRDANYREISKQKLTTNEFGSVSGEFVIPQGILPGYFTIETVYGYTNFNVAEYKRPTFEITFDKIDKTYKFGEEITLNGKAESFSGIKLQNAVVEWNITRQHAWWWRWGGNPEHFTQGFATTDENGKFSITFTPDKSDSMSSLKSAMSFAVEAVITDINGETQVANYTITVGDISMYLQTEMPAQFEKNSNENIVITAKNLDGADIEAEGSYIIYSLQENDSINKMVAQGQFKTGKQDEIKKTLSNKNSGKYRLKLTSQDDRGNTIEAQNDFILYSYRDKRPPIKTDNWYIVKSSTFSSNKSAEVILGASGKVNVLYELWQEDNLIERKWVVLKNENRLFTVPFKNEYSKGVTLMLTYIKDQKFYFHTTEIHQEKETEELKLNLDVFRDKIRPGTKEEWRISITDAAGNPRVAEILASMYDFSLDAIQPTAPWNLNLYNFKRYSSMNLLSIDQSLNKEYANSIYSIDRKQVTPLEFDRFNWFDFHFRHRSVMAVRSAMVRGLDENVVVAFGKISEEEVQESSVTPAPAKMSDVSAQNSTQLQSPQVRKNFNETAFFFPQLRTNDKGETQIVFDVPENNTRWRFRVLAHDINLNSASAEAFTISQKELMITPNMPRFLRQGDNTSISAKISNLSDLPQQVKVSMEFIDPVSEEVINNIGYSNREQEFTLNPGASTDAMWMFPVPSNIDVIGVRIVAKSEYFSDGEQHALAVLPNRILVTESMRIDIDGDKTKTYTFDKLKNSGSVTKENYKLTLEFTSNPAWYAVQSLPVLGQPASDNAVSWFASYYANSIGAHIGNSYPKVSAMVNTWIKSGGDEKSLISNLEKNEELKNIVLLETPWVMEAKNETEQMEKLSLLFDLNRSRNITSSALTKLQELQTSEGGWSWFKGFRPSISITQYILYGFSQLKDLRIDNALSDQTESMQSLAISYIDAEAIRRFELLKEYNKDWEKIKSISITDLEYLFVRSIYNNYPKEEATSKMYSFYLSVIEKNWTKFGLYERSLIAQLMKEEGKDRVLQDIIKSYREHSVVSEEMGMYWPNNRANVFMSQSAISVHTFIMDAFLKGGATDDEMNKLKKWLLKQKQTQQWETTHATADAVHALLRSGSDWFEVDGTSQVTIANKTIEPKGSEAGTGYFKESWSRTEITPEMANISVTHKGSSPSWGALYLQYFEDIDKIKKSDASLDIEKMMFVEETTSKGKQLRSISNDTPLKVGDKVVVRITVRSDRDMEFVHIKDLRSGSFEPVDQISGIKWQNGLLYYQTSVDASTNFYFDNLPRGTYILEYSVYVTRKGNYSSGISTIQSLYSPEFTSHTEGSRIEVIE